MGPKDSYKCDLTNLLVPLIMFHSITKITNNGLDGAMFLTVEPAVIAEPMVLDQAVRYLAYAKELCCQHIVQGNSSHM